MPESKMLPGGRPRRQDTPSVDADAPRAGGIAARALAAARPETPDYLAALNPEQREAVETVDGPVLVLAGAGTGKTRVLTTRIAHILATERAWPRQILAVTFTNKAAREMRARIGTLIGGAVEGMPWLGTFHSLGVRFLRRHAELVGLRSGFTILDSDDSVRLMKQLVQAAGIDEKRWPARALASLIDGWKNRGLGPADVPPGEGTAYGNGKGVKLYTEYQARLKVLNAADFGDLLLEPIRLFRQHPDVLKEYHRLFRYILVDEYQDTNVAQYMWLRLLAQGSKNICCVGDDDQSIYGWRGAEVDNILRFEHDFPGARVIRLERNYRSTTPILAAASHLIAHNEARLGKTLFTDLDHEGAEKVGVAAAWDSEEEARAIGEEIERLQRKSANLDEVAILVRASFQMREFEDRFLRIGVPFRVIGGPRFYERQEVRDALAYFRVVFQPADDLAFERIMNVPKRGLGEATLAQLYIAARERSVPLTQAAADLAETEELKPAQRASIRGLLGQLARWRGELDHMRHSELGELILDESGYVDMWRASRAPEAPGRLDNLKELVRAMDEFDSMAAFLEHIALVMDAEGKEDEEAVSIMTLHSAKGLEFDTVFLPGWEEGLFPNQRALDEGGKSALEEERRLAYVGLTRAKKRARIWFASNRRVRGTWQSQIPSRFLDELPASEVEVAEPQSSYGGYARTHGGYGPSRFDQAETFASSYGTPGWQRAQRGAAGGRDGSWSGGPGRGGSAAFGAGGSAGTGRDDGTYPGGRPGGGSKAAGTGSRFGGGRGPLVLEGELVAKSVIGGEPAYGLGARVFHQKFGYGAVVEVDGNKLTIDFEKAGRKRVLDSFVTAA